MKERAAPAVLLPAVALPYPPGMQQPWGYGGGGYGPPGYGMQPMAPMPMGVWVCPFCRSPAGMRHHSKVSGGGWVFFFVFLVIFFPICWIGLLMRETTRYCLSCNTPIAKT